MTTSLTLQAIRSQICYRKRCWAVALVFVGVFGLTRDAKSIDVMTGSAVDQKAGITFTFRTEGVRKSGYRSIDLEITRRKRINVDRRIVFNIKPYNWNRSTTRSPQLRHIVDMPQGTVTMKQRLLIPQTSVWGYLQFEVFEDGERIRNLSINSGSNRRNEERLTETFPGWWFIDSDFEAVQRANKMGVQETKKLPNVRALLDFMPHYESEYDLLQSRDFSTKDFETLSDLPKLSTVQMTGFSGLPTNWLEYTCFDIVVISYADLQQLQSDHPQKWQSLRTFVRQGANLVVYEVGTSDSDFANLSGLGSLIDGHVDKWQLPKPEVFQAPLEDYFPNVVYYTRSGQYRARGVGRPNQTQYYSFSEDYSENAPSTPATLTPADKVPPAAFRIRPFGLGRVAAISSNKPFRYLNNDDRGQKQWGWLLKTLGTERVMWYQRHSLSNGRRNADFWNFLVKGVGAAPVLPFLFLITAFVLVIGPANYYLLRKWKRLYLILFTVPFCAALVTTGLMAYAFLADGISTRMRLRSFTLVDSAAGDAITWSRQSYYAGLPPSDGITFPTTAAAFPVIYAPDEDHDVNRLLRWDDDKQVLARGYLRTRTLAQFMVYHSQETNQQIRIQESATGLTAKNEFAFDVEFLIAIDPIKGVAYTTESIGTMDTVTLREISLDAAKELTAKLIAPQRLTIPVGVDFGYGSNRYWDQIDADSPQVQSSTSILETSINELRLITIPDEFVYFAVTHRCHDFVPRGAEASTEEDGFHVIKGYWKP